MQLGPNPMIALLLCGSLIAGCKTQGDASLAKDPLIAKLNEQLKPIEMAKLSTNQATKAELGRKLFFEPRLSANGAISCNSCHNLASYGVDNRSTSLGHKAQLGGRNSPTVLNATLHASQFWDGRAANLTEQAKGPILNPIEMALPNEAEAVARIASIEGYQAEFKRAFPDQKNPISYQNIAEAIATFESTLVTPSRFDRFLKGDTTALTTQEKTGAQLFVDKGCVSCHNGAAIGGGSFQKFGLVKPYARQKDPGRFAVTQAEQDRFAFKVPSLRNITRTYPYFHDGQVWDLEEAITIMAETQLGLTLSDQDLQALVSFLSSLEGDIPEEALRLPVLPPSGKTTSKPI